MRDCMLFCMYWKSISEAQTVHTFAPRRCVMQCERTLAAHDTHCTEGPVKTSVHALHVLIIHVVAPRSDSGPMAPGTPPRSIMLGVGVVAGASMAPTLCVGLMTH